MSIDYEQIAKAKGLTLVKDCYFKDVGDHYIYMSGLPIPVDADGICRGYLFVDCQFHAGCWVPYENCEFINCDGTPSYIQK